LHYLPWHNYYIFRPPRDVLHGCQHANYADVTDTRQTRFCARPKTFFADGSSTIKDYNCLKWN
jgi:hypothetical protein